ncbi:MAG: rod shape-determining protein MreD [Zetaproteobacteria bacterium]|nr:MAG: rod shape-determining protein MreD [Zetaproteobacteria bacterium]
MSAISEQMDGFLRICVPYIVMFILFIFNMVFFSTPLSTTIEIPFVVMVVYYWSIYRPTLIPPLLVFIVGLCLDFISGFPVGLSSFVFMVIRKVVSEQRLFLTGQPFMVIWLGFAVVSTIGALTQWFLFGLMHVYWTPIQPVNFTIVAGILLFPVIALFLNLSHRVLPLLPDQYSAVK